MGLTFDEQLGTAMWPDLLGIESRAARYLVRRDRHTLTTLSEDNSRRIPEVKFSDTTSYRRGPLRAKVVRESLYWLVYLVKVDGHTHRLRAEGKMWDLKVVKAVVDNWLLREQISF